jgi:predicted phosphohydrolase
MSRAIESVCNCQVEFWSQLTTAIPDLNVLNDLGNKIYAAAERADYYWVQLVKINPNYPSAL